MRVFAAKTGKRFGRGDGSFRGGRRGGVFFGSGDGRRFGRVLDFGNDLVHPVRRFGGQEGGFEIRFGDFAGAQGAFRGFFDDLRQFDGFDFRADAANGDFDGLDSGEVDFLALGHGFELRDQVVVVAIGFVARGFETGKDDLDAVDRVQDQGHGNRGDLKLAVAEAAEQGFTGVRHGFKARKPEEPAGALNRVNQPENIVERLAIVRIGLEPDKFAIDNFKAFSRFGQEFRN